MNPFKKLLGQTAVYGLSSIVGRTLNFLLVPLYISAFKDPSDYGVVSELYAWVAFLVVLLTFGMETSFFRFLQDGKDKTSVFQNTFWITAFVSAFFLIFVAIYSESIANAMLFTGHSEYIMLLAFIVVLDAIAAVPLAKLRQEEKAVQFVGIQFSSIAVNIGLNLILMLFVFDNSRPEEGILFILIANLISSAIRPLLLIKTYLNIKFSIDWKLTKEILWYSFPLVIAGFAGIVNETIDRILLKHQWFAHTGSLEEAERQVGIYSANYKLAMLVTIALQAYRYAAEPFFFSLANHPDKKITYVKVMNYFVALVSIIFLVVSLNIDIFKYFITNEIYREGLKVVPILLFANVFLGIYFNQSIWYKLSNQTKYGAYIAIGGAILTVLLNVMFIKSYGYMACAWATCIVYAAQMVASYVLSMKYYPIKYNLKKFFTYIGLALLLFFFAGLLNLEKGSITQCIVHNGMIVFYIYIVARIEKLNLGRLLQRK